MSVNTYEKHSTYNLHIEIMIKYLYHSMLRSFLINDDYIHPNSHTGLFSHVKTMQKTIREKILQSPFWDNDPKYPRVVPWDQNFVMKIFLILCWYHLVLWYFVIYWPKIGVLCQNHTLSSVKTIILLAQNDMFFEQDFHFWPINHKIP